MAKAEAEAAAARLKVAAAAAQPKAHHRRQPLQPWNGAVALEPARADVADVFTERERETWEVEARRAATAPTHLGSSAWLMNNRDGEREKREAEARRAAAMA